MYTFVSYFGFLPSAQQSLLERFEETLAEAAQEDASEMDYATLNQEPEHSQSNRGWNTEQDRDQEAMTVERSQAAAEGQSRALSQRSRLLDLLVTARKRASGCFGARMDRNREREQSGLQHWKRIG
ncbi:natriuretic peptides A [Phycodurus eques]|uniref:natriuretic peptides A n=1 Tax=Phycodurus eques TaxID=693459 RepID=UPI002ACE7F6A|nr:natriuretic peptides A [Phycodurus eques]